MLGRARPNVARRTFSTMSGSLKNAGGAVQSRLRGWSRPVRRRGVLGGRMSGAASAAMNGARNHKTLLGTLGAVVVGGLLALRAVRGARSREAPAQ